MVEADTDAFGEWVHEISGEKFLSSFERVLTLLRLDMFVSDFFDAFLRLGGLTRYLVPYGVRYLFFV